MTEKIMNGFKPTKKDVVYYINAVICVLIMFGFGKLPSIGGLPPLGMEVIGIFLGLLYGWVACDMLWPSFLGLIALGLTEYTTVTGAFAAGFGNDTTIMLFLFFAFSAIAESTGLTHVIANWFISRKICVGRPWVFVFMLCIAAFLMGCFVNVFAGILIMWGICYRVFNDLGFDRNDAFPKAVLVCVCYADVVGFNLLPFHALPLLTIRSMEALTGGIIDFVDYTIVAFILSIVGMIALIAVCKYILRIDVSKFSSDRSDKFSEFRNQKMTSEQICAAILVVGLVIMLFIPSLLPSSWAITKLLSDVGVTALISIFIGIGVLLRYNGEAFFNFGKMVFEGVEWSVIIMFTAIMAMTGAINAPEAGIADFLVRIFNPILESTSPIFFSIIIVLISSIVSQFLNNVVTCSIMVPVCYTFSLMLDGNPLILATLIVQIVNVAFLTPTGSVPAAFIHGNKTWFKATDAYFYGALIFVLHAIIVLAVGYPIATIVFP